MSWGCPALLALSPGALLTWILGSAHLLGTEPQSLHSAHLDPADCGICSPGPCRLWHLLTCLGLCPKTCILLTWTLQTVGSAHLDPADCGICSPGPAHLSTPWTCSCCWICSPGSAHLSTPWTCSPCGICVPGPAHLDPADCGICSPAWDCAPKPAFCSPGPHRLWDLLTWTLQIVGSAHLSTPWICSPCGTCVSGPAHVVGPAHLDLLTWPCSPCGIFVPGPAHLDPADCGICSPGSAHLSTPRTCSPCGTCVPGPAHLVGPVPSGPAHLDAPRPRGHRDPNPPIQLLPPSRCFPEFLISPLAFPADFPHWALTLTLLLLGATCAP
ncbi:uncharacterized protein LOC143696440 isoform X11 [Agelaius phoeniceus]|uniref:uncharacterized protein LOC143696440 isoform X11 n=1 Tax=Agelaius phoeniceus TaxID=39638 RepID=UPI004054E236